MFSGWTRTHTTQTQWRCVLNDLSTGKEAVSSAPSSSSSSSEQRASSPLLQWNYCIELRYLLCSLASSMCLYIISYT